MQTESLVREFNYNGAKLVDPAPSMTIAQVRDFFSATYPEIVNAEIEGPVVNGSRSTYTFRRAVGTKGSDTPTTSEKLADLAALADSIPLAIRAYLRYIADHVSAHLHPLLDEELAFIDALHTRFAKVPT